eukprot:gene11577-12770_t
MQHENITRFLANLGTDWITWKTNPPAASHHGGVWERQIKSARSILTAIMQTHPGTLNDESLSTLMAEAEAIINSRPLTVETISEVNSLQPLSPNTLLTQKTKVVMPPPGSFSRPDQYSRKQWRRVQHLALEFWTRGRKEFLLTLQERQRWLREKRNFQVGDIVLMKSEAMRCEWPLARITQIFPDERGNVRKAEIQVANNGGKLQRPITKLVLIMESGV